MGASEGRYQKVRAIAAGGMATVYLGRTVGPGGFERLVAIKVMHSQFAENEDFVAMFLDEARLAARIRHPNVVATFDVVAEEQSVFLVMEYVEGASIGKLVRSLGRGGRLPIAVTLRILADTLAGLHAAHELVSPDGAPLNLVHRDVSPHNILVGVDGISRITDFGVARAESRLAARTATGQVKGKYAYMSYEQLHSQTVDRRSDVYSAGIVLWELLAGQRLFRGESEGAVALAAARGPVQSPRQVNHTVPAEIDAVVMRALATSPDERFSTAAAFAEALEDATASAGIRIAKPREVAQVVSGSNDDSPTLARPISSVQPVVAEVGTSDTPPVGDTPFSIALDARAPAAPSQPPPAPSQPPPPARTTARPPAPSKEEHDTEIGGAAFGKAGTMVIPSDWADQERTIEMPTEPLKPHAEIASLVIPPMLPRRPARIIPVALDPAPPRYSNGTLALAVGVAALVVAATFSLLMRGGGDSSPAASASASTEAPRPEPRPAAPPPIPSSEPPAVKPSAMPPLPPPEPTAAPVPPHRDTPPAGRPPRTPSPPAKATGGIIRKTPF